jgi:ADP-ribose pyrophosphatase YjhB (NUDIX family)
MCLSVFLFVRRGAEILVGKYAPHEAWERLTGLDPERVRKHGLGWTIPASHLKYGEDPRAAARRVAEDVLGLDALALGEPRVETEYADWARPSGSGWHYDVWFFVDAEVPAGNVVTRPPWFAELAWADPRALPEAAWARSHGDVARRWLRGQ